MIDNCQLTSFTHKVKRSVVMYLQPCPVPTDERNVQYAGKSKAHQLRSE